MVPTPPDQDYPSGHSIEGGVGAGVLKQIFGTDQITFKDCGTWHRTKMTARRRLVAKARDVFRAAGYPFVLTQAFDRRTPSHQCGTVRMGTDPATSVLDVFCRTHDHANLFAVDAAFLPTSAAVNPSLTIAAQALRVADHIVQEGFRA